MNENESIESIHILEIDEYLASRLMEEDIYQLSLEIGKSGEDGFISITSVELKDTSKLDPIDFELSTSEYHRLNDIELEELLSKPLVTSSALELFDFLLLRAEGFRCTISFTGSAWKINILNQL